MKIVSVIIFALALVLSMSSASNASSSTIISFTVSDFRSVLSSLTALVNEEIEREKEKHCLALAIYHEARGETVSGQFAVAAVIMNRARSSVYPDTVCDVVFENAHLFNRCQFSFACDRISDKPRNVSVFRRSAKVAELVMSGAYQREVVSFGASHALQLSQITHYHRHDIRTSWSPKLKRVIRIGDHVFFSSKRVTKRYSRNLLLSSL